MAGNNTGGELTARISTTTSALGIVSDDCTDNQINRWPSAKAQAGQGRLLQGIVYRGG
jgi:hypothetical protein